MALNIEQDDDFLDVAIGGQTLTLDVLKTYDTFGQIDLAHADDAWTCWGACRKVTGPPADPANPVCPVCGEADAQKYFRDQRWLDACAAYIVAQGASRCSRKAAGEIYTAIVEKLTGLKKNTTPISESPTGSESTPAVGAMPENEST